MTTWHQQRAGVHPWSLKKERWMLITDGPGVMLGCASFGEDQSMAEDSFEKHTVNQPGRTHYLFYNNALVKAYDPKKGVK